MSDNGDATLSSRSSWSSDALKPLKNSSASKNDSSKPNPVPGVCGSERNTPDNSQISGNTSNVNNDLSGSQPVQDSPSNQTEVAQDNPFVKEQTKNQ
jgi:hypothetical protein